MSAPTRAGLDDYRDLVETRRAVRAHRTDEYGPDVLDAVLGAANVAPSAAGAHPWRFLVVRDDDHRRALSEIYSDETKYKTRLDPTFPLAGNAREFVTAPATVLVVGDRRYERWWPRVPDGTPAKLHEQSVATCIMTLHLAGVTAGLGTTWVTTRGPTQGRIRDLLDLPEWYAVGSAAPLGYPDLESVPLVKSRFPAGEQLHRETLSPDAVPSYDDIVARKEGAREDVYRPDVDDVDPAERWRTPLSTAAFRELVESWRPVHAYREEPVEPAVVADLVATAVWAPSGANAQPWEFVVVESADGRSAVADALREDLGYRRSADPDYDFATPRPFVHVPPAAFEDAPAALLVLGNRHLERLYPQVPDGSRTKLFRHSVAAATTAFLYGATAAGVGTAPLTPTSLGERRLRAVVDAPSWFSIECVTPLGYPADDGERELRRPLEAVRHEGGIDAGATPSTAAIEADAPRVD